MIPEKTPALAPDRLTEALQHPAARRYLHALDDAGHPPADAGKAVAIGLAVVRRFEDGRGAQVFDLGRAAGFSDVELDVLVGAAVSCFRPAWLEASTDLPSGVEFSFALAPELRS